MAARFDNPIYYPTQSQQRVVNRAFDLLAEKGYNKAANLARSLEIYVDQRDSTKMGAFAESISNKIILSKSAYELSPEILASVLLHEITHQQLWNVPVTSELLTYSRQADFLAKFSPIITRPGSNDFYVLAEVDSWYKKWITNLLGKETPFTFR